MNGTTIKVKIKFNRIVFTTLLTTIFTYLVHRFTLYLITIRFLVYQTFVHPRTLSGETKKPLTVTVPQQRRTCRRPTLTIRCWCRIFIRWFIPSFLSVQYIRTLMTRLFQFLGYFMTFVISTLLTKKIFIRRFVTFRIFYRIWQILTTTHPF